MAVDSQQLSICSVCFCVAYVPDIVAYVGGEHLDVARNDKYSARLEHKGIIAIQ